ncbi:Pyrophosphoryl-undecaprenol N-acetylglucosamine transferase, partial [Dissostichus eleginoides]
MMATVAEEIRIQTSPCPVPDTSLSPLSVKLTRKHQQDRQWSLRFVYLQCYFLTIATILGTGILGLPVTISHAGLVPFLFSFLVGFFVQALLIYLFVELLQKCQVVQLESLKTGVAECIVMDPVGGEAAGTEEEDDDDSENAQSDTGLLQPDAVSLHDQSESLEPNLHLLGYLFLSRPMSHAFNFILLFQFISIGISYVLAGSEAYAALLNVSHIYVIPAFTWILTLAILVAHTVIQPITSLLTLLKGILLIVTKENSSFHALSCQDRGGRKKVAVTFAVGSEVGLQSSSDFSQMGKPFLMGTVALGGIVNVMPLLYSRISHNRTQIMWFRRAVLGGLTTCTVLNILWCWAVLEIVPQTSTSERRLAAGTSPDPGTPLLYSNISLEESERAGEIATIPLTK